MKSPERVLKEWALDRITFDGGGKGKLWSREELERLAAYLRGTKALNQFMESLVGRKRPLTKALLAQQEQWINGSLRTRVDWDMAKKARDSLFAFDYDTIVTAGWLAKMGSMKNVIRQCKKNAKKEKRGPFHE